MGVALGVLSAALGLAPWLLTGARSPLQNLWAGEVLPEDMPVTLLPLSQYHATTIVALLTVGGALAGLAVRIWRPGRRRLATGCAAAGVSAVHAIAVLQAFTTVGGGLTGGAAAALYMAGLLAGTVAAMAAAVAATLLLAAESPVPAALGIGLMAVPAASWVAFAAASAAGPGGTPAFLAAAWRWLPAVLVGAALAWCGFRPAARLAVWVVNLLLLWLVPALFTSVSYVLGTRAYLGDFGGMAQLARQILAATLGPDGGGGPTVAVALAIGLAGAAALELRRRRVGS